MKCFFVTGTDTGVGKTVACAWLVHHFQAHYWKPVQSGTLEDRDAEQVIHLAQLPAERVFPSIYEFKAPLSPHRAAQLENRRIELDQFVLPSPSPSLVVEGAGGVLVPLNEQHLMVDLIRRLNLPVLVVARSGLGTINHTLLTLEALRHREATVAGVILNGPENPANRHAIEQYGQVKVIGEIPPLEPLSAKAIANLAPPNLS